VSSIGAPPALRAPQNGRTPQEIQEQRLRRQRLPQNNSFSQGQAEQPGYRPSPTPQGKNHRAAYQAGNQASPLPKQHFADQDQQRYSERSEGFSSLEE